jgi:hypothetical protein
MRYRHRQRLTLESAPTLDPRLRLGSADGQAGAGASGGLGGERTVLTPTKGLLDPPDSMITIGSLLNRYDQVLCGGHLLPSSAPGIDP